MCTFVLKTTRMISISHTHFVNKKMEPSICVALNGQSIIFKSRLRIIGTLNLNRVMTVSVEYPGTRTPDTTFMKCLQI